MKTTAMAPSHTYRNLTLCLAAACAGLGIYAVSLHADLAALRGELAARAEQDRARPGDGVALMPSDENVARIAEEGDGLRRGEPEESGASDSAPVTAQGGKQPFAAIAQTFGSPEMRQFARREALNDARKEFGDLIKKWNLPAAEADQFLEFVADRDSAAASDALAMLATGKLDAKSITEQGARRIAARKEYDARLKTLLSDEQYAEFEAASARAAEKEAISSYHDHLESTGVPLTDDQRSALAKIVKKVKPDENDWQSEDVEFFTQGMTDAHLMKLRQRLEAAHTRISQEATGFLSPDQVAALQGAFRNEVEEQDLALKMARTLFQPPGPTAK
jgi:hypothetical protein